MVLATNIVNNSVPSTASPTAIFTYGYRDSSGTLQTTTTIPNGNLPSVTLASIVSVTIQVLVDANLNETPAPVNLPDDRARRRTRRAADRRSGHEEAQAPDGSSLILLLVVMVVLAVLAATAVVVMAGHADRTSACAHG